MTDMTRCYTCRPRRKARCLRLLKPTPAQQHYCKYVCPSRLRLAMAAALSVIVLTLAACTITVGGVTPAEATAAYGAEQFHIQLTAQAEEGESK